MAWPVWILSSAASTISRTDRTIKVVAIKTRFTKMPDNYLQCLVSFFGLGDMLCEVFSFEGFYRLKLLWKDGLRRVEQFNQGVGASLRIRLADLQSSQKAEGMGCSTSCRFSRA